MIRAALTAMLVAAPASAVGLGPLSRSGVTDGPQKGFYLTLINPYPGAQRFALSAIGWDAEDAAADVVVQPRLATVAGRGSRRLLVVVGDLAPGETHKFRVCGELARRPVGETIHARVCSRLTARRLP